MYRKYLKGISNSLGTKADDKKINETKHRENCPGNRRGVYEISLEDGEDLTDEFSRYADQFMEKRLNGISLEDCRASTEKSKKSSVKDCEFMDTEENKTKGINTENNVSYRNNKTKPEPKNRPSDVNNETEKPFDELDARQIRKKKGQSVLDMINRNSIRSSISYTYQTNYENEDDLQNYRIEEFGNEFIYIDQYEKNNRRSAINAIQTDKFVDDGGINLYSDEGNHFLEIMEPHSKYCTEMNLRTNDKILGINEQAVDLYSHNIVLELLRELLSPGKNQRNSLIIEREEKDGQITVFEVEIETKITSIEPLMVNITAEVCSTGPFRLRISSVRLISTFECMINCGFGNTYVIAENGGLYVKTLKDTNLKNSIFRCHQFDGLSRQRSTPTTMFIAVFQSVATKTYIMASSSSTLTLVEEDRLPTSMDTISIADPRHFRCTQDSRGGTSFESLVYRGSYWTADRSFLTLREQQTRFGFENGTENIKFDLIRYF